MNVFQWAADDGGSWWYRMHHPGRVLRLLGHTVHCSERALPSWLDAADVIVGQRVSKPGPSQLWRQWAADGRALVYDADDDLSVVDRQSVQAYLYYSQAEVQTRIAENMAAAALVTCASQAQADWAGRHNPRTAVIPNGLPAALLARPAPAPRTDGEVVVGWAGSPQSLPELSLAARAMARLAETMPQVELHTVGLPAEQIHAAGLPESTRSLGWRFGSNVYLAAIDFDIWVAPYRNIPFNVSKYPTKSLEAMFLGIPIVCSAIGPYEQLVEHGVTGFVVRREHEWGQFLRRLVLDETLRQRMGDAARQKATGHTFEGFGGMWEAALSAAMDAKGSR